MRKGGYGLSSSQPCPLSAHTSFRSKWEKREVGRIGTKLRHKKKVVIHFFFSRLDLCVVENVTKRPYSDF